MSDLQSSSGVGFKSQRVEWPSWTLNAYVNVPWRSDNVADLTLSSHRLYRAAKGGDESAAIELVEDLLRYHCLDGVYKCLCSAPTLVCPPAKPPRVSRNVLATAYAAAVAREFCLEVETGVIQKDAAKRDRTEFWQRFVRTPEFYGNVRSGCDYILADDVLGYGGTLAALRAFIECKGGRVICMTAIAGSDVPMMRISLDSQTLGALNSRYGQELDSLLKRGLGYGVEQLTEREGRMLLREQSLDAIRKSLVRGQSS